jgi:alpha-glucoside transport system permease protein
MEAGRILTAVLSTLAVPAILVGYSYAIEFVIKRAATRSVRNVLRPWLWMLPALVLLGVFMVYPVIRTTILSFYGPQSQQFVGLQNYEFAFTNPDMLTALRNNGIWLVVFVSFTVGIGLLMAVLTDKVQYESIAKSVLFMPMAISYVAASVIWRFMYQYQPAGETQTGTLNALLTSIFPSFEPRAWTINPPGNNFALIVIAVWIWTGFSMVILSASIKGVNQYLIDSARIDGATSWQVFWRIIFPIISPTVTVVTTTMVINVLKIFDIVYVMTNGRLGTEVIANRMYKELFNYQNYGRAASIAVILFVAVLPVIAFNIRKFIRERA